MSILLLRILLLKLSIVATEITSKVIVLCNLIRYKVQTIMVVMTVSVLSSISKTNNDKLIYYQARSSIIDFLCQRFDIFTC